MRSKTRRTTYQRTRQRMGQSTGQSTCQNIQHVSRAFTLLEMVVVMTMAGLLMALAMPALARARDGAAVRTAASELASTFSLARQRAIAQREAVAIVVDTAGATIELRATTGRHLRRTLGVAYGIRLGANRDSVVYDARGLGYGVSNITLVVRRGGAVDTLTVSRLGRVR